jgi:hypothetical protein
VHNTAVVEKMGNCNVVVSGVAGETWNVQYVDYLMQRAISDAMTATFVYYLDLILINASSSNDQICSCSRSLLSFDFCSEGCVVRLGNQNKDQPFLWTHDAADFFKRNYAFDLAQVFQSWKYL